MNDHLFPKDPKRTKQPTKDTLREQLALSAQVQIELLVAEAKQAERELSDNLDPSEWIPTIGAALCWLLVGVVIGSVL